MRRPSPKLLKAILVAAIAQFVLVVVLSEFGVGWPEQFVLSFWLLICTGLGVGVCLARRRAMKGMCPKCGYSLAGLAKDAPCPECGQGGPKAD